MPHSQSVTPSDFLLCNSDTGLVGCGDGFGNSDTGRKRRSRAAADVARVILAHAGSESAKAGEIVDAVLSHVKLKSALTQPEDEGARDREAKDDIIHELVESICALSLSINPLSTLYSTICLPPTITTAS